jgi:concanavalin A-like lectin/glucanase superfamily protein/Big-like domain-containing protein/purple acid phosphatase-like protein
MTSLSGLTHRGRLLAACALVLAASLFSLHATAAAFPGGFIESDTLTVGRQTLNATQVGGFLPQRGPFTFPAPYNTQGLRITNSSDCGGQDCVDMIYSYWRNMSNSTGSNLMYIFIGLDRSRGGQGPTLFSYDKTTDALTEIGPMFPASSPYSWNSAEGWYFSYGMPTKLYMQSGSKLMRYDVLAKTLETVFDSTTQYPGTVIAQTNSSNDDDVHSATLENASSYVKEGCVAYKVSTKQFYYYPSTGGFDECQIDKSGRYLVIKEKLPQDSCTSCDEDNLIVDLQTGAQTVLLDKDGAGGHSDLGYGTQVASDNWNNYANAWRVWDFTQSTLSGGLVYHDNSWGTFAPSHLSWENASASVPVSQQYACGGAANSTGTAYGNEVVCFMLNPVAAASQQRLVVAPVMSDLSATGGNVACPSCTAYAKDPKGNIDPTGQYFFWVSNMGGSRMDAFMVKIPSQLLTGATGTTGGDITPPTVSLGSPLASSTLSGTVTVSANAGDNLGVASVQFLLDGADLGSEITTAPYSVDWDTSTATAGTHILSAIAKDAAGNSTTANSVAVTTFLIELPPAISSVAVSVTGSSTATVSWVTSQLANSQVAYGTSANYGSATTLNTSMATSHSYALTGLNAGTTYHYQVISSNASGIQALSLDQTFTTAAAGSGGATTLPNASGDWQLNAGSGSNADDSSGHRHTGTLVNRPAWTTGIAGDGLAFNGSNQSVSVQNASSLNPYPLTISTWFKTTSTSGTHGLVNKYAHGSDNGYQVFMSRGRLCAWYFRNSANYVWDGTGCTLPAAGYNDGHWHMVTFTVGADGGSLYVDGTLKASRAWNGKPGATTTTSPLSFAVQPGVMGSNLGGNLDEIRLYAAELSTAQVANLYASFPVASPAAWTGMVNITATGNSLQKTAGCSGCEDASALSQQQIASGSKGYIEFTAAETNTLRSAGLKQTGAAAGYANMAYAIRLQSGRATVGERGVYKADTPFVSGDVFRIAIGAGAVRYSKNGTVFYTSSGAPTYPLQASASINDLGGTISNAVIKSQ